MPSGFALKKAARVLRDGGIVAYPTEAVYGFGCDPLDPDPVFRILDIKRGPVGDLRSKILYQFVTPADNRPDRIPVIMPVAFGEDEVAHCLHLTAQ